MLGLSRNETNTKCSTPASARGIHQRELPGFVDALNGIALLPRERGRRRRNDGLHAGAGAGERGGILEVAFDSLDPERVELGALAGVCSPPNQALTGSADSASCLQISSPTNPVAPTTRVFIVRLLEPDDAPMRLISGSNGYRNITSPSPIRVRRF